MNTTELVNMLEEIRNNAIQNETYLNTSLGAVKDIDDFRRSINAAIGTFEQSLAQR